MILDPDLWHSLPVPALVIGPDDTIYASNLAAEGFLNLPARLLEGEVLWDKVVIDTPIEVQMQRARVGQGSLFVNDVQVGSGERAPVHCNIQIAPYRGGEGQMIMMISPREIASRMTQASHSEKASKTAIGMAEMLAHEIKNPLAGITGAAQLLSMGLRAKTWN